MERKMAVLMGGLAASLLLLCATSFWSSQPQEATRLQLVEVPMRSFAFRNPNAAVMPRRLRVAPFHALYSASLGADPQSFLQKAPEQGKPGLFRSYMPPLRGEVGGTPEYKYSEEMPPCPCAGVAGMCLDLLMDEPFDQVATLQLSTT